MARSKSKGKPTRKKKEKEELPLILIVTEGEKTEVNYFKSFDVPSLTCELVVEGASCNTISVVKAAAEIREKRYFDEVWCVFDYDDNKKHFDNAVRFAKSKGYEVAYSNECFEYWLLLHFELLNSAIKRDKYNEKLNKYLIEKYDKRLMNVPKEFKNSQNIATAIKHAKKMEDLHDEMGIPKDTPSKRKPSTTVHLLVELLEKYKKK